MAAPPQRQAIRLAGHDGQNEVVPCSLRFAAGRTVDQPGHPTADSEDGPSLSVALQQQLGLKLEMGRGPMPVLAVDHIERLTEN